MSSLEHVTDPITRTQIVRFAGAAGDFNPMHHDEPFAIAAGQRSVFAMGQLTAAVLAEAVAGWFGAGNVAGYAVRFRDKVWPGDRLVLRADSVGNRWELSVTREVDGATVITGWVRLRDAVA
jgi:acyl dehydratase